MQSAHCSKLTVHNVLVFQMWILLRYYQHFMYRYIMSPVVLRNRMNCSPSSAVAELQQWYTTINQSSEIWHQETTGQRYLHSLDVYILYFIQSCGISVMMVLKSSRDCHSICGFINPFNI